MRVAVTGATGFLGRHVVPALVARGAQVTAAVRPGGAPRPWLAGLDTAAIDIAFPSEDAFDRLGRPEAIVHLAWQGLPNYRSLHHFETELPIQYRFLKLLVECGLSRLVVAGTCFEYGMQSGPLSETLPTAPNNPYGYAKDALRRQLQYLKDTHPFALVWARLFYMYGEGQGANSLLPQLERAIASGEAVFHMSGGEQLRDYLSVTAIAECLARLAICDADTGPLNVCSGTPKSVRAVVEEGIAKSGASIALDLGHYPYPDYEPMAFWGDRSKLDDILEAL